MTKLNRWSLDWGLKNVVNFGDGDIFPSPFEYIIIKEEWENIIQELQRYEIESYRWNEFRRIIVPKDELLFRNAIQLHPLDAIMLGGVIKEIGEKIEKRRSDKKKVYSYRFKPKINGELFDNVSTGRNFWEYSADKAKHCTFVVKSDIIDFYNQISHNIIKNQLEDCKIDSSYTSALMNLIKKCSKLSGIGIPIGPHPFHLIAELSLIPIDLELDLLGIDYIRFGDDFYFFCNSADNANMVIFDFWKILEKFNFNMNRYKTKIIEASSFVKDFENFQFEFLKIENIHNIDSLKIIFPESSIIFPEAFDHEEELDRLFSKENVEDVLTEYLESSSINYNSIRWFLINLGRIRFPTAVDYLIEHFLLFKPIISTVINYFRLVQGQYIGKWESIGEKLIRIYNMPVVQKFEYLQIVILNLFSRIQDLNHIEKLVRLFEGANQHAKRKIILAVISSNIPSWLENFKDITNLDPWLRRAIIYASKNFKEDDRNDWLKRVKSNNELSFLESSIVNYILKPSLTKFLYPVEETDVLSFLLECYNQPSAITRKKDDPQIQQLSAFMLGYKTGFQGKKISIIDVGAGNGDFIPVLKKSNYIQNCSYYPVEKNEEKHKLLKKVCAKEKDFDYSEPTITFPDIFNVNLVFIVNVLHELSLEDRIEILYRALECTRNFGFIIIHEVISLPKGERDFFMWNFDDLKIIFSKIKKEMTLEVGKSKSKKDGWPFETIIVSNKSNVIVTRGEIREAIVSSLNEIRRHWTKMKEEPFEAVDQKMNDRFYAFLLVQIAYASIWYDKYVD